MLSRTVIRQDLEWKCSGPFQVGPTILTFVWRG